MMNQDEVKEKLMKLYECKEKFTVVFSGKKDSQINGLYKPITKEILINNRNFSNDEELFYTAMHELAHHLQYTEFNQKSNRSHNTLFFSILDDLAEKAEKMGIWKQKLDDEVSELVEEAVEISLKIAALQRRLGSVLIKLHKNCNSGGLRYEDIVKRKIKIAQGTEKKLKKIAVMDMPETIGFDLQETIAGIRDDDQRQCMLNAAADGKSFAQIKQASAAPRKKPDGAEALVKEKTRIERTIENLTRRLKDISRRIQAMEGGGGG
jgi:hypothetical protein